MGSNVWRNRASLLNVEPLATVRPLRPSGLACRQRNKEMVPVAAPSTILDTATAGPARDRVESVGPLRTRPTSLPWTA